MGAGWSRAEERGSPGETRLTITGKVVDEGGKAVAQARVRLYRREGRWERRNPVVDESKSGADGSFRLSARLEPRGANRPPEFPQYVVLGDHPGKAVGWVTIPANAKSHEAVVVLSPPSERTISVTDAGGTPVAGALVVAYGVGDPSSSAPYLANGLELRPGDGPLTAKTGADGRAKFTQLPRTQVAVVAQKRGFAEGYAFEGKNTIRLTPSSALSGTITGPDGTPLAGVAVVLFADFMWHFERTVSDAHGKYQFEDLMALGWDMSAWAPGTTGTGKYRLWLDSERFAIPTRTIVLEPRKPQVFDIKAQKPGVVKVTVVEDGTDKPVPGVRVWGFDAETGSSGRFNAYTDEHGMARFYSTPAQLNLSIAGPPEGVYLKGDMSQSRGSASSIVLDGNDVETTLVMPPIAGPLIEVSGTCTRPDGSPATDATVNASAGRFVAADSSSFIRARQTDARGKFTLAGVPAGLPLHIYAETKDRTFAGATTVETPAKPDRDFQLGVKLGPTVAVDGVFRDARAKPVGGKKFRVSPQVESQDFPFVVREAESDADGRFKISGIVPGLHYRIEEIVPAVQGPVAVGPGGRPPWYQEVLILAPKDGE
jgi:hypothetical protein